MIIKLFGMAIVLISSSLIGFGCAERMAIRERALSDLSDAAQLMHGELLYSRLAICEIVFCVTSRLNGRIREVFDSMCDYLRTGDSAAAAWTKAIEDNAASLELKSEDMEIIKSSACLLEVYDFDEQARALAALGERLQSASKKAALVRDKNSKIVKMLGIYCGILLCIMIF